MEPVILSRLGDYEVSDYSKILAAYARHEMLWGLDIEDLELRVTKDSGFQSMLQACCDDSRVYQNEMQGSNDVGTEPPSFTSNANSDLEGASIYYPPEIMANMAAASKTESYQRLFQRNLVNAFVPKCLDAIRSQTLTGPDCINLLFAFIAQRPRLLEASLINKIRQPTTGPTNGNYNASSNNEVDRNAQQQAGKKKLQLFGRIVGALAYELVRWMMRGALDQTDKNLNSL